MSLRKMCIAGCASDEEQRMQCNIDARGKAIRLVLGFIMLIAGVGVIALPQLANVGGEWMLYAGIGLIIAGAFGVFEGRAGWCVVRAMGFKTRV